MQLQEHSYADGNTQLRGYLAYDETQANVRPGIIVVPEAPGLTEHAKRRVRMLAELGYVAMGVDLYGDGRFGQSMEETMSWLNALRADVQIWRARIAAAMNALRAHPRVDAARMGAIGYCFGGSSVLELARSGADVRAVVSFHGELNSTPHAPSGIKAKILVCQASNDQFAPPDKVVSFEQEMEQAGADWEVNVYGGTKHGFTSPESDHTGMPMFAYQATADRRSWKAMQVFLAEALA